MSSGQRRGDECFFPALPASVGPRTWCAAAFTPWLSGEQPSSPGCGGNGKSVEVGQDLPRQTMELKQGIWFSL